MVSMRRILVAVAALTAPVLAVTTPAQVVENIGMVTRKSLALQEPAKKINLLSGPLIIVGQGPFPQIILGFADIVTTVTTALADMKGMDAVPAGSESDAIFEAFREFVRVHQALLNILIGKAGLFNLVPGIGAPVAAALRAIESVVDAVAFALIDAVQGRSADLKTEAGKLGGTLKTAIKTYDSILGGILNPVTDLVTGVVAGVTGGGVVPRQVGNVVGGAGGLGGAGGIVSGAVKGASDVVGTVTGGISGGLVSGLTGGLSKPVSRVRRAIVAV